VNCLGNLSPGDRQNCLGETSSMKLGNALNRRAAARTRQQVLAFPRSRNAFDDLKRLRDKRHYGAFFCRENVFLTKEAPRGSPSRPRTRVHGSSCKDRIQGQLSHLLPQLCATIAPLISAVRQHCLRAGTLCLSANVQRTSRRTERCAVPRQSVLATIGSQIGFGVGLLLPERSAQPPHEHQRLEAPVE
jgi:hypothetical protein